MNSTMFKSHPSDQKEGGEYDRKATAGFRFRLHKHQDGSVHRMLRKAGSISGALAVPTLLGIALGMWMDTLWPIDHSWLSVCLPFGILLGCLTAVLWLSQDKGGAA